MDHKKLALIHIVKKELGLSDEEYRAILRREAGVDSAKDLTDDSFRQLMRYLVRSRHYTVNPDGLTLRQKLYIKHLQQALGWDDEHLNNFLHKYHSCTSLAALPRAAASKTILAMEHMQSHRSQKDSC
ncbi:MAG: phage protein GemA/Gp16 family protein [bacterium]